MAEPRRKKVALAKKSLLDLYDQYKDFEGLDKNVVFDIIKDLTPEELASLELLSKSIRRMVIRAYPLYWKYRVEEDFASRYEMTDKLKNNLDSISRHPGREETYWKRLYERNKKGKNIYKFTKRANFYNRIYFPIETPFLVFPSDDEGYLVYLFQNNAVMDYNIETKTGIVKFYESMKNRNAYNLKIDHSKKKLAFNSNIYTMVIDETDVVLKIDGEYTTHFIRDNIVLFYKKDILEKVRIFMLNDGKIIKSNEQFPNLRKIDTEQVILYDNEYLILSNARDYYSYYIYSLSKDRILVQHKNDEIGTSYPIGIKDNILYSLKIENAEFILIQYSLLEDAILDKRTLKSFTRFKDIMLPPLIFVIFKNRYILFQAKTRTGYYPFLFVIDLVENIFYPLFTVSLPLVFTNDGKYFYFENYIYSTEEVLNDPLRNPWLVSCNVCGNPSTLVCGGCQKIAYCSTDCQENHWETSHHNSCE